MLRNELNKNIKVNKRGRKVSRNVNKKALLRFIALNALLITIVLAKDNMKSKSGIKSLNTPITEVGVETTTETEYVPTYVEEWDKISVVDTAEPVESEVDKTTYSYNYLFTEEDKYKLAKIATCEAGTLGIDCMEKVIKTVINRTYHSNKFPNTIYEVIFQNKNGIYQFTPCKPNGSWYKEEPTEAAYEAVSNVLNSSISDTQILYFEDSKNKDNWHSRNLKLQYTINGMRFYSE